MVKLQLKLQKGTSKQAFANLLSEAKRAGASAVRPLFPSSTDPSLSMMYMIDAKSASSVDGLVKLLSQLDAVDFVEPEVKRALRKGAV